MRFYHFRQSTDAEQWPTWRLMYTNSLWKCHESLRGFAFCQEERAKNSDVAIIYDSGESLWFHAHLVFGVIPGTHCCTLIKCLRCVDHTCRGVLASGATVSFGCLGVPGATCRSAVCSTLLSSWQQRILTFYTGTEDGGSSFVFTPLLLHSSKFEIKPFRCD